MATRRSRHDDDDEDESVISFLREKATIGRIESQCEEYLNNRTFRRKIHLESGDDLDELSIFQPVNSLNIQQIIDDHQDLDTRLRGSPPQILPLTISKIAADENSFIIPSEDLSIDAIHSRAPEYLLEAVICKINQRLVIFMKNLPHHNWFYYQEDHSCVPFNDELNESLNRIIQSTSTHEQKRLLKSAHFLVSMIFYNAVKYFYKQKSR